MPTFLGLEILEWLGFVAGFLTTFAWVPQIMRIYRLKEARSISLPMMGSLLIGMLFWIVYGWLKASLSLMVINMVSAGLITTVIGLKWVYTPRK